MSENHIISADNGKIKQYVKLSAQKKYRDETGLFTLEGERLVKDAIKSGFIPEILFTTEALAEAFLPLSPHIITETIAKKISETKSLQGVFAVCKKPGYIRGTFENRGVLENQDILEGVLENHNPLELGGQVLVLAGIADPGNMGTILRTADALGITVIAFNSTDIFAPKVVRASMGSIFRVKLIETDENHAFELLKDFTVFAAVTDSGAQKLGSFGFPARSAVIIGNEANGIPEHIINRADISITIEMNGNAESLNAASAASIIMWELHKGGY
jgi:TrmH family RNA methyltransferase